MENKKFNLSLKRKEVIGDDDEFIEYDYSEKDIKEFIKRLKKGVECFRHLFINSETMDELMNKIDNLAGDDLNGN